jgi:SAM-dependent methyltransferase
MNQVNEQQAALWNGAAGRAWVETQVSLDRMFRPFDDLLVEAVAAVQPARVLDIGCGTGSTTLAVARRFGAAVHGVGIDISAPMIEAARLRAQVEGAAVEFIRADAQVQSFAPANFDMLISRFGVMFFDDPVAAFANLARAAAPGATLACVAFRSPAENTFMTAAERAAAPLLPELPARVPGAPGQFAFADAARVRDWLERAGWAGVDIAAIDVACRLPLGDLDLYLSRLGPVGLLLQRAEASQRSRVLAAVRSAFDAFVVGDEVRYSAGCWRVSARRG